METLNKTQLPTITRTELVNQLKPITKSTTIAIEYITDVSTSKTIKGVKQVQKHVRINNLYLNHDYTKKVINLTGDTSFTSYELKGKTRICGTLIQSDKTNEILLDGKILNSESVHLINYFHNNEIITEAEATAKELCAPSHFKVTENTTSGRGLVDIEDDFKMITLGINKIIYIKFLGNEYKVID